MNRRGFLRGLFIAAPAIVAAPSLMRVSALVFPPSDSVHDLLMRSIKQAEHDMIQQMNEWLYSDGTSHDIGLRLLLTEDALVVGGINRANYTWYNHSVAING